MCDVRHTYMQECSDQAPMLKLNTHASSRHATIRQVTETECGLTMVRMAETRMETVKAAARCTLATTIRQHTVRPLPLHDTSRCGGLLLGQVKGWSTAWRPAGGVHKTDPRSV